MEIYIIYSHLDVMSIFNIIRQYDPIGTTILPKVEYDRMYKLTNRSLVFLDKETYQKMVNDGLDKSSDTLKFSISPYVCRDTYFPKEDETTSIFMRLPKTLSLLESRVFVENIMKQLCDKNIVKATDYTISLPPLAREQCGQHRGFAIIGLNHCVSKETAVVIRAFLNRRPITDSLGNTFYTECSWFRVRS